MKQLFFVALATTTLASHLMAQSGSKWALSGNTTSAGDILGTTNNQPIRFHTNNTLKMVLDANGNLQLTNLAGTGNRLMMTNSNGQLTALPQGAANQVLLGNGTWGNMPTSLATSPWITNGNKLVYNGGYVGIGISNPQFPLDVIGDARISNNLYVGGGIIITDKVSATDNVTTGALEADSIKMGGTKAIYGLTRIEGDVEARNELTVTGNAIFNSTLKATQGIVFDNFNNGIKMTPQANGGAKFSYGQTVGGALVPIVLPCAAQPQSFYNHQFGGILQIFDADNAGNYVSGSGLLNIQAWQGGSSIDASIGGNTTGGGLLLNYFCGNNTFINTGSNGGAVVMGSKVSAAQSVKIGDDGTTNIDPNTPLAVYYKGTGGDMLTLTNVTTNKVNFKVKDNGAVYSREVNVQLNNFPDYVFKHNYSLMPLDKLAQYIAENKHLPNVPNAATIQKEGANLGELSKLQFEKIEELTLYILELKKEIEALKKGK